MTIIGLGEDGLSGLSSASQDALREAKIVFGAARHLNLLPKLEAEIRTWPTPYAYGIPKLLACRGQRIVVVASGDPFWFGAGSVLARYLDRNEWRALPNLSSATLASAYLGWPLEQTQVFGLHAAPFARLRPALHPGARLLVLVRDGASIAELGTYITQTGFGSSAMWVLEALGGPRQRVRKTRAEAADFTDIRHPVCVALDIAGGGATLPLSTGLPDDLFDHDGQITKRPVRAVTLSALAPLQGQHLWDIGAGSGAIGIEWMLAHTSNRATAIEQNANRATRIRHNAQTLGVDRLKVFEGSGMAFLQSTPRPTPPDAIFIGGGLSQDLLECLWSYVPAGTRVVANSVTLETDTLLARWHAKTSGALMRLEISNAAPLGRKRSWKTSFPITQWSVLR